MSDLLPPNATKPERAISLATARLGDISVPTGEIYDADLCPINLLPWLAWSMDVETWDSGWSENQKRSAIKEQFKIHKLKGTVESVNTTADAFGVDVILQEWFEQTPVGDPYTFKAIISIPTTTVEQQESIKKAILGSKPVRSEMVLEVVTNGDLTLNVVPVIRFGMLFRSLTYLN